MMILHQPIDSQAAPLPRETAPASPRLSAARMYELLLAGDPAYNGRFFTAVLTTGIYCLPSCKARKPKRGNVRFFPSTGAAREAGFRPCRKCHPDDFARGADPVLETIEDLVAEMRDRPADFEDSGAIVRRSGFGATRLFELFRQHYHTTPADLLVRARVEAAKTCLLSSSAPLASIAQDAGFESLSVFHENFRRLNGMTPAAYRELPSASRFVVSLPDDYPLGYLRRALSRDPHSLTERLDGDTCKMAVILDDEPAILTLNLLPDSVTLEVPRGKAPPAHAVVVGLLGLEQDTAAFGRLVRRLGLARLVAGRPGMRLSQTPSLWDGLLWSVIGQQISFPFACLLRRRVIERAGIPVGDGLYATPPPEAVASLTPQTLVALQFSRQKAAYVVGLAHLIAEGKLDLGFLARTSATRAARLLLAVHGLGPWSVNYVLMRSLGFLDCVPLGDTGVASGLQALLHLEERPGLGSVRRLTTVFAPFRSLATAHLWQYGKPPPL